jgi:hypothetical protein
MSKRLQTLGIVLALFGLGFLIASGVAFVQVQNGYGSLQNFSDAQNVNLSYNEDGQLIDRGTTEGAAAIMTLLTDDWGYAVIESDLDPNDPQVNTATEYMFQMATIGYHILHGTQTVVLDEAVEYDGVTYDAGSYDVVVNTVGSEERVAAGLGGYWTDFDRQHPLEGPARSQAWTGTAHGLFAELGVGTITHSALQIGLAVSGIMAGVGLTILIAGFGMIWVARSKEEETLIEVSSPSMPKQTTLTS